MHHLGDVAVVVCDFSPPTFRPMEAAQIGFSTTSQQTQQAFIMQAVDLHAAHAKVAYSRVSVWNGHNEGSSRVGCSGAGLTVFKDEHFARMNVQPTSGHLVDFGVRLAVSYVLSSQSEVETMEQIESLE